MDLDFQPGTVLASGDVQVVVAFDPTDALLAGEFRTIHDIGSAVPLIGPWEKQLANNGEEIRLLAPTDAPIGEPRPVHYLVDRVTYDDTPPWPTEPDGTGKSLSRNAADVFGDDAENWQAAIPSPGSVDFVTSLPADFDGDNDVDGDDFLIWQAGYPTFFGATHADGDADGDSDVDGNDFLIWQSDFISPTDNNGGGAADHRGIRERSVDMIFGKWAKRAPRRMAIDGQNTPAAGGKAGLIRADASSRGAESM